MKSPHFLLFRSTLATVFCCIAASFLSAQTPTPTPPVDTDGDGVSDIEDGWPFFPQLSPPPVPECQYIVIDLGLGAAFGLNNLGDVVGETYDEDGNPAAVLWPLGQSPVLLGFLTNDATATRQSRATAINDDGVITGYATYTWDPNVEGEYPDPPTYPQLLNYYQDDYHSGYWDIHAFRWEAGVMTDLNDLSFGQTNDGTRPDGANKGSSAGWAINSTGMIAGDSDSQVIVEGHFGWHWTVYSYDPLDPHAVRFSGNAPTDLNVSPGTTSAFAINDAGSIVGYRGGGDFGNGPESDSAFLVDPNGQVHLLGLAGGIAVAINNSDHVLGYFGVGGGNSLWPNNYGPELPAAQRVVNLGAISQGISDSYAVAINDRVQIVGGNVLWQNGSAKKLKDLIRSGSGWILSDATAINQNGWIAASGRRTGEYDMHAVLLLPVEIQEVISDQISGNEANKLPTGEAYVGDDNNPMLMASRNATTAHLAVRIDVPSALASSILVGVKKTGSSTVATTVPAVAAPAKTLIEFDAEEFHASNSSDLSNLYEVVAGYDSNGDGTLQQGEIGVVFDKTPGVDASPPHDKFRVVTKQLFDSSATDVEDAASIPGTGLAGALLGSFITGENVSGAAVSTFTLTSADPGLSHPVGAVWSASNTATAPLNTFLEGTAPSDDVEESTFVYELLDEKIEEQKAEIVTYFVMNPTVAYHDFTFNFTGSRDFNETDPGILFSELGKAFGKVAISGTFTARCAPIGTPDQHRFWVMQIDYSGNFEDLYDFSFFGGASYYGPAMQAACVQAGYATLSTQARPSGRVFKNRVEFETLRIGWPEIYDASGQP
ncbi:MAG TPA: hypothetical protein VNP98_03910 [Chthoniobacterales bacterium]|nr:hypothetical protein [Chthoniobacterales bacterium]